MSELIQNQTSCELTAPTYSILRTLQLVLPIVPTKSSNTPIIENFWIRIKAYYLKVTGYDHKNTIMAELDVKVGQIKGDISTCINAHILVNLLKSLPQFEEVKLEFNGDNLTITSNYGTYQIFGQPEIEFPKIKFSLQNDSLALSGDLVSKIVAMNYACSTDDLRPALKGIYCNFKPGKAEFISTNGYIIHLIRRTDIKTTATSLIPGKELAGLAEIVKGKDYINVALMENHMAFSSNECRFFTTKIAEKFPDYDWIFEIPTRYKLKIFKYSLVSALERISILQPDGDVITFIIAPDKITLKAQSSFGAVNEIFECKEYLKLDESAENEIIISFFIKKLLQVLKHLDVLELYLCISAPNKLLTITPVNKLHPEEEIFTMVTPVLTPDFNE